MQDMNYKRNGFKRLECKKAAEQTGTMIYLGFKFLNTVTRASLLAEALLEGVDLAAKRRLTLKHLLDMGYSPYHEDRLRRRLLALKPLLTKHQVKANISLTLTNVVIIKGGLIPISDAAWRRYSKN